MEAINVHKLEMGDQPPLGDATVWYLDDATITLYLLKNGTRGGQSAVMFDVEHDGVHHLFQTTAAVLKTAMIPIGVWTEDEVIP